MRGIGKINEPFLLLLLVFLNISFNRDDRYQPYYREDPHHYPSSSNLPPRDYSKLPANIRRDGTT